MSQKKCEISCDSTLTQACKPMTRSDSTVLVTRSDSNRPSDDSARKNFRRLWLDSDS